MGKKLRENKNLPLEEFCLAVIKLGVYLSLFAPVIVWRASFFPFVTPKTIYFRVLVEIASVFYLVLAIYSPRYRPKINAVSVSVFLFFLVFILTSYLGINFERSFWSTFERMTGILTQFHLVIFLIILTSCFTTREDWERLLTISILVGIILCFHVVSKSAISSRGGGTIGNTSFMAAYLLFDIFFALILFLEKKSSGWRIFTGASWAIFIPVLINSHARGATVSFFWGIFLLCLLYLLFSEKKKQRKLGIFIIIALIVLLIFLAVSQPPILKKGIERLLKEMKPRFVVWEKAWKGFLERPIFGWGPENFNVVFLKFFNPCIFLSECGGEIWFDRAHNIVLDTLVTMGVVGLVSYLLIFTFSLLGLLKTYLREREHTFCYLGMISLLTMYFFQNLLVFDMISSYVVFFLSLGFTIFLIKGEEDEEFDFEEEISDSPLLRFRNSKIGKYVIFGIVIALIAPLLYFGNIQPAKSAEYTVKMMVAKKIGVGPEERDVRLSDKMDFFKKALNTLMEKYEIREQFAQQLFRESLFKGETKDTIREAFKLGEEQMEISMRKNSLDFRSHLFAGRLYSTDYRILQDRIKLDRAEKVLNKAIELSPTNQQGYWYLTEVKMAKGQTDEALKLFQKAIDLEPRFSTSHWYLGITYLNIGEDEKAAEEMRKAYELGYKWKESDIKRAARVFERLKDHSWVATIYTKGLEINPQNTDFLMGLATAYANLGEIDKARDTAMKARKIDPNLIPKIDEFLNSL